MTIDLLKHVIIDNKSLKEFLCNNSVVDEKDLDNGLSLISINGERKEFNDQTNFNVSIGIAAAITAYARIHMMQYLQDPSYKVYYTDTDSIVTNKPLSSDHIGKALGQLKLEYNIVNL